MRCIANIVLSIGAPKYFGSFSSCALSLDHETENHEQAISRHHEKVPNGGPRHFQVAPVADPGIYQLDEKRMMKKDGALRVSVEESQRQGEYQVIIGGLAANSHDGQAPQSISLISITSLTCTHVWFE